MQRWQELASCSVSIDRAHTIHSGSSFRVDASAFRVDASAFRSRGPKASGNYSGDMWNGQVPMSPMQYVQPSYAVPMSPMSPLPMFYPPASNGQLHGVESESGLQALPPAEPPLPDRVPGNVVPQYMHTGVTTFGVPTFHHGLPMAAFEVHGFNPSSNAMPWYENGFPCKAMPTEIDINTFPARMPITSDAFPPKGASSSDVVAATSPAVAASSPAVAASSPAVAEQNPESDIEALSIAGDTDYFDSDYDDFEGPGEREVRRK